MLPNSNVSLCYPTQMFPDVTQLKCFLMIPNSNVSLCYPTQMFPYVTRLKCFLMIPNSNVSSCYPTQMFPYDTQLKFFLMIPNTKHQTKTTQLSYQFNSNHLHSLHILFGGKHKQRTQVSSIYNAFH